MKKAFTLVLILNSFILKSQDTLINEFGRFIFYRINFDEYNTSYNELSNNIKEYTPLTLNSIKIEDSLLIAYNRKVKRDKDTLIFNTNKGTVRIYDKPGDGEGFNKNIFSGYIKELNSFFVGQTWWESHSSLLINEITGKADTVQFYIQIQNDMRIMICAYIDLVSGGSWLDMYSYDTNGELELSFKLTDSNYKWNFEKGFLDIDRNLLIKNKTFDGVNGDIIDYYKIIKK